jgi:pimeloyl-ACP methyl ester carboxylesterase
VALAALTAVLTANCGGEERQASPAASATPSPALPASAAGARCAADALAGRQVRFGVTSATELGGVLFGAGRVGVVLAHQANADLCNWAAFGRELGSRGYRALAFDFSYGGASADAANDVVSDVGAAVAFLRREGVDRVVLMGSSMGGTAAVTAAAQLRPPVAGVVSVSAPRTWLGANAAVAAARLRVPVLYIVGERDGTNADDARTMYGATAGADRKLVVVGSPAHGMSLVDGLAGEAIKEQVRDEIDGFLARVAPAGSP